MAEKVLNQRNLIKKIQKENFLDVNCFNFAIKLKYKINFYAEKLRFLGYWIDFTDSRLADYDVPRALPLV